MYTIVSEVVKYDSQTLVRIWTKDKHAQSCFFSFSRNQDPRIIFIAPITQF